MQNQDAFESAILILHEARHVMDEAIDEMTQKNIGGEKSFSDAISATRQCVHQIITVITYIEHDLRSRDQ